ncbi:MAG: sulfoxide reductase heme-binding subunit YedZ [Chloroflexi bacterium]|nr:sulfoxide reductase heme-binding subunit YedZ [Chloroflexota bacterium]
MRRRWTIALRILTHLAALSPLAILIWDFAQGQLTVNPIQEIQLRTGKYALILLVLSLACTPISTAFRTTWVLSLRRPLGLYAFMYASLHFLNFIGLDYGFDFAFIWADIAQKRFALAGFATFLLLLTVAVTSTRRCMKRLGKKWERLHRLVYIAAPLAVLHFIWQAKADIREPLAYGLIVAVLLVMRTPPVKRRLSELGGKFSRNRPAREDKAHG